MNRAKPYKIFLVLAVVVAGIVCMFLPEKKVIPLASMSESSTSIIDEDDSLSSDNLSARDDIPNHK